MAILGTVQVLKLDAVTFQKVCVKVNRNTVRQSRVKLWLRL